MVSFEQFKKDVYDTIQTRQQKLANKIKLNKFKKDLTAGVKLYQKKLEDLASEEIPTPKVRQQLQRDYEHQLTRRQRMLSLAREPSEADMEERYRIKKTYHKVIEDNILEETSLCFHGVKDITAPTMAVIPLSNSITVLSGKDLNPCNSNVFRYIGFLSSYYILSYIFSQWLSLGTKALSSPNQKARASRAASCSASRLLFPFPLPMILEFKRTSTSKCLW